MADDKTRAKAFRDEVVGQLNQVAPICARAMFGGYGLYCEGVMFALIAYETLYFKVDAGNQEQFANAGMGPFVYDRNGKTATMSYYRLPTAVYNDLGLLHNWVEASIAAARRSKGKG